MQGMKFAFGILLARLLYPEQFGLIGMLTFFLAVAQSFTDSGYGAALIQKREATQTDTSSIFYFNIAVGLAVMTAVCLAAPWIAAFYNQPELTDLTRAMSLIIVINSFGLVHSTMIHKHLAFKTLTKVSLIETVLAGSIGVTMALKGFGVWSLVVQQVAGSFVRNVFLWLLHSWRPTMAFSLDSLRQLFGFGSRMLASGLLDQIFSNIYLVVIGKLFTASDLGYFTRARSFQEMPTNTLSGLVARVAFPVFSSIQNDPARLRSGMKKALTLLALVQFPMMIGLVVIARPLVLVLVTEKWAECVPYLQLLCLGGLLYPAHLINLNILMAVGRSDLFFRLEIVKKMLIAISIAVTWRWGISAMLYGLIGLSVVCYYLNSYYTGILIRYPFREQVRDMAPYLMMAALMGAAVYAVGLLPSIQDGPLLALELVTGCAVYVLLCRLFRLEVFMELWEAGWYRIALLRAGAAG